MPGGQQVGFASLVDLNSGQVVWFNRLARETGDLRTADEAAETDKALRKYLELSPEAGDRLFIEDLIRRLETS